MEAQVENNQPNQEQLKDVTMTAEEETNQFILQNYLMVVLIALIQGSLDLCLLAYFYIYYYDHKATPATLAAWQGIAYLPWIFKPVFGQIAERFKFFGYNKKSYIFAISLLEFMIHTLIFKYRFGQWFVLLCNVLQVTCICFRNVIAESLIELLTKRVIIRDRVPEGERKVVAQKHVTLFFGAKAIGSMIGAWQSTVLMEFYGNRGIFLFSSVLPLVIMIYCSFFYEEYREEEDNQEIQTVPAWNEMVEEIKIVGHLMYQKKTRVFLGALFMLSLTPQLASTFNFFNTAELKLELATMSQLSLAMSMAYFLSILMINFVFKEQSFKKFFLASGFLSAILNFSLLFILLKVYNLVGVSALFSCFLLFSSVTFMQELNLLPLLGACCRLCPDDLQTTAYGIFSSFFSISTCLASFFTSLLLKMLNVTTKSYSRLWLIIVLQVLYQIGIFYWLLKIEFPKPWINQIESQIPESETKEKTILYEMATSQDNTMVGSDTDKKST